MVLKPALLGKFENFRFGYSTQEHHYVFAQCWMATANDGMDTCGNILSRAREILMIIDKGFSDIRAKRLKMKLRVLQVL